MSNTLKSLIVVISIMTIAVGANACIRSSKSGSCTKSDGGSGNWACMKDSLTGCYDCQCTSL